MLSDKYSEGQGEPANPRVGSQLPSLLWLRCSLPRTAELILTWQLPRAALSIWSSRYLLGSGYMNLLRLALLLAGFLFLAVCNRAAEGEEAKLNGKLMSFIARHGPVAPPGLVFAWHIRTIVGL